MSKRVLWIAGTAAAAATLVGLTYFATKAADAKQMAPAQGPVLSGNKVLLAPGKLSFSVAQGVKVTFVLPAGATWVGLATPDGDDATAGTSDPITVGPVEPNSDTGGSSYAVNATWRDVSGNTQVAEMAIEVIGPGGQPATVS